MTVSTTTNKIIYDGQLGQETFAYNFRVDLKTDMEVYIDGIIIPDSVWTITGLGNAAGGDVILNTPLVQDDSLTLLRSVDETQLVDYQPFDAFPAEVHEGALDKLTFLVQQLQELIERNPIPPPDSTPGDAVVSGNLTVNGSSSFIGPATFSSNAIAANAPTDDTHLTRKDYVDDADAVLSGDIAALDSSRSAVLTAMVGAFAVVPPNQEEWVYCNGQAVTRSGINALLFAAIGEVYGNGNGSTTFNVPDYRGEFLRGMNDGSGNDPDAAARTDRGDGVTGDVVGTKQADEFGTHDHGSVPDHTHDVSRSIGSNSTTAITGSNGASGSGSQANAALPAGAHTHAADGGSESRPRNVSVRYYIHR